MISARMDAKHLNRVIRNTIRYSDGFLDGIEVERIPFMTELGEFAAETFKKYIDLEATANPDSLHHVYEWGAVGSPDARLFRINSIPRKTIIRLTGDFLPSKSISQSAERVSKSEPFTNKAEVMENSIQIVIQPKDVNYLKFFYDGIDETVFHSGPIYIAHPGGDAVAGSFGRATEKFFSQYFTRRILEPFLKDLEVPDEYTKFFPQGANGGGYSTGNKSGRLYLSSAGMKLI